MIPENRIIRKRRVKKPIIPKIMKRGRKNPPGPFMPLLMMPAPSKKGSMRMPIKMRIARAISIRSANR
jgi:hypothetical protein